MPQVFATPTTTAISSQVQQLANDGTTGTMVTPTLDSSGAASKLSLFGPPAVAGSAVTGLQSSGYANSAVTRGQVVGTLATYATTATPASIATLTTQEVTLTPSIGTNPVWTVTTTDILVLNKPTSQVGLGYGNVRYSSATTIGLTFNNISGVTLTPTATQIYGVTALRGVTSGGTVSAASGTSITITPTAVITKTTAEQQFTLTGAAVGQLLIVNKPTSQAGLDIVGMRVVSNNLIGITYGNFGAGTLTPTSTEAYTVLSTFGLDAASTLLTFQGAVVGAQAVPTVTTAEVTITSGNFATQDQVVGISKPTLQAGLMTASGRLSGSTTMAALFVNPTAVTLTPTQAEVLTATIQRQNPVAPLIVYQVTLTPTSVATLTTAEQTFVVTGLVAGSPVWVNKPSVQPGLGIVGARVSSANNLAINFLNTTAGTLTPVSEVYTIGNFQMPIDTTTANSWIQQTVPALTNTETLANATRAGMVAIGAMAGS